MKRNEAMKSRPQIGRLFAGALLLAAAIFPLQSFAEVRPAATILALIRVGRHVRRVIWLSAPSTNIFRLIAIPTGLIGSKRCL
jgi:hypothetical protein